MVPIPAHSFDDVLTPRRRGDDAARRENCAKGHGSKTGALTDGLAWAGTFHGIGARLLREYSDRIGINPAFTIHDREDSADLVNLVRHDLGFSKTKTRFPTKGACLSIYSRCVNAETPIEQVLGTSFPWCSGWADELKRLFAAYVEAKQRQNVLDYDDLLLYWAQTMVEPALADDIGGRFDHVLVDEYQDTNRLQSSILLALKPGGHGLTVVGDDAQSIYSFRAATVRNILDFPNDFSPPAHIVTLDRNYRSTERDSRRRQRRDRPCQGAFHQKLVDRSNVRHKAPTCHRPRRSRSSPLHCRTYLESRESGTPLKQQAVLFRTSSHSGSLEVELTRHNIPFVKFGGLKFLDAAHVKDMLALLRFVENPRDRVAGFRLMHLIPGLVLPQHNGCSITSLTIPTRLQGLRVLHPATRWRRLERVHCSHCRPSPFQLAGRSRTSSAVVRAAFRPNRRGCRDPMRRPCPAPANCERLSFPRTLPHRTDARSARRHKRPGRRSLARRGLFDPVDNPLRQRSGVEVGVRLNVVDGCMPSDLGAGTTAEIEEERRLLYVAMNSSQRRPASDRPTALFYARSARTR